MGVRTCLSELPPRRALVEDGERIQRTVLNGFDLLVCGMKQREIAKSLKYSEGSVSLIVKDIRKMPEVQGLLKYWSEVKAQ